MENLLVYPKQMQANLDQLGGLVHSQQVLLALTQAGVSREDAYKYVQRNAMRVWQEGGSYLDLLKSDEDVRAHLDDAELESLFDLDQHFRHVDTIFDRVFTDQPATDAA
jgi:adenylosuccinate lyase